MESLSAWQSGLCQDEHRIHPYRSSDFINYYFLNLNKGDGFER
jgi:hypothetical protein